MTSPLLAVGRLIVIAVRADPESCQATAGQLARLGEACETAAAHLAQQGQFAEEQLGGLSGIVYRQSLRDLAARCERLARDCARLAAGLGDYARDVAEVRRLMGEAVAVATPYLTVTDREIWSPVPPPRDHDDGLAEAWTAWHEAVDWWRRARALEDAAEQQWLQALAHGRVGPATYDDGGVQP